MVAHKRKEKLETNVRKREEKLKELQQITNEIERLEEHKKKLDLKEEMWLRGGFEEELGVMQDLKNKLTKLMKSVEDFEEERNNLKNSYHDTREKVMALDAEHERQTHEYEYVKRLSATMLPALWNTGVFSLLPVHAVKPNQMSNEKLSAEGAYSMAQPKGVAMIVSNDEPTRTNPKSATGGIEGVSPQPSRAGSQANLGAPTGRIPAAITSIATLCAQLGFYNIQRHSLPNEALRHNMAGLSDQYHSFASSLNSLLVIVSARSDEWGRTLEGDGTNVPLQVSEYLKHFTHDRCPALLGKPKIFLFLLRVTEHEPRLPVVGGSSKKKKGSFLSSPSPYSDFFQPEPLDVNEFGDDMLVVRIMHQAGAEGDLPPTFGGISSANIDKMPWHTQVLVGTMLEQAGYKDFLSLLDYVKEEVALGPKIGTSPTTKAAGEHDVVEIFIDHSLKKKLYLTPGI